MSSAGEAPVDRMAKRVTRASLLAARRALTPSARRADAARLGERLLALPELTAAATVAAYAPIGPEPGDVRPLDALRARGTRLLLPVLLPDGDLDWADYAGSAALGPGLRGTREPAGPRLGRSAVRSADVVVVPALAVDRQGRRLGRGGGSYDRVLARLDPAVPVVALLYDGELVDQVPAEPHDRAVTVALTPSGVHRWAPGP